MGWILTRNGRFNSRYLADYADALAISTLKQRLAALAQWHIDQAFLTH